MDVSLGERVLFLLQLWLHTVNPVYSEHLQNLSVMKQEVFETQSQDEAVNCAEMASISSVLSATREVLGKEVY